MANIQNSNVFFKSGSQAKYDALTSRDAGTFYVTHDTHRLYLGNDLLSQAVEIVTSLPAKTDARAVSGTIFYLEGQNILAIFDKTANDWVQLNPDTSIEAITFDTKTADGVTELNLVVKENRSTSHNGAAKAFEKKIKFSGAKGITVTPNAGGDGLVITAPELTVGAATGGAEIGLDAKKVPIVGNGSTTVSYDSAAGKIKIASSYENTKITGGEVVTDTLSNTGFNVSVLLESKTNGNPDPAGGITLAAGNIDPIINIATGKNEQGLIYGSQAKFENGTAQVDTYNTAYLDKKFQETLNQVNAMTYKGKLTVTDGNATLPNSGVHIGDTYILPEAARVDGSSDKYQPGTLFIAKGTEGDDGIIVSDLSFDSVLTSDSDTTYRLVNDIENGLSFWSSTNNADAQSVISIAGDNYVNATITSEEGKNNLAKISVSHKAYSVEETKDASAAVTQVVKGETPIFTVVDRIEQDNGHITKVITKDVQLLDTVTKLSEASFTATAENNVANIHLAVKDDQSEQAVGGAFKITSNTLTLSADQVADNVIKAELVWGSFD